MKGEQLIDALKKRLGTVTDRDLCRKLGLGEMTPHNWRQKKKLTPRILAAMICRLTQMRLSGNTIIKEVSKKLDVSSQRTLASDLGITVQAVQNWKNRFSVTPRQIAGLIFSTKTATQKHTHAVSIRPLVEFFPIKKTHSKQKAKYELFSVKDLKKDEHPFLAGLKDELDSHYGVYVFFDSRGQAIYSGKAHKQTLWKELNLAFNRYRDSLQKIRRIKHPSRKQKYQTTQEKSRQIKEYSIPLHELAFYFSAYEVADGMVDVVESLLVRGFANDLLNKRMETFGRGSAKKQERTLQKKRRK